jgi:ABC-type polysaccharide/polyol phosphate export permease
MVIGKRLIRFVATTIIILGSVTLSFILARWTANQDPTLCQIVILLSILIGILGTLSAQYIDKKYPYH